MTGENTTKSVTNEARRPESVHNKREEKHGNGDKSLRKRNRPSFVCTNCRKKKIKCDKNMPCTNCVKSHLISSCHYMYPSLRHLLAATDHSNTTPTLDKSLLQTRPSSISLTPPMVSTNEDGLHSLVTKSDDLYRPGTFEHSNSKISLENDVQALKSKMVVLEQVLKGKIGVPDREAQDPDIQKDALISIFVIKSKRLKLNCLLLKKSRILHFGFASIRTTIAHRGDLRFIFLQMIKQLDLERKSWKKKNDIPSSVNVTGLGENADDFSKLIESNLTQYYEAMLERIDYFGLELNDLLMDGLLDIVQLKGYFHSFFVRNDIGEVHFSPPEKAYLYSNLALVLAVVKLAVIFSDKRSIGDQTGYLKNEMDDASNILIACCSTALNLSRFHQKQTITALESVMLFRLCLLHNEVGGDGGDAANLIPFLHTAISIGLQVGLHRSLSCINGITSKEPSSDSLPYSHAIWKKLWAQLKFLDSSGSLIVGSPLIINDLFTDNDSYSDKIVAGVGPERDQLVHEATDLFREATIVLNSVQPVSLNDIVAMVTKLIDLFKRLGTFLELLNIPRSDSLNTSAWKLSMKLFLLETIQGICTNLRLAIKNHKLLEELLENRKLLFNEIKMLEFLDKSIFDISMKSAILSMLVVKTLFNTKNVFSSRKHLVYLKSMMTGLLVRCFLTFASTIMSDMSDTRINMNASSMIKIDSIDYNSLEVSIWEAFEGSPDASSELIEQFRDPKQIVRFLCEFYQSIVNIEVLNSDYDFFVNYKLLVIICLFIDSTNRVYVEQRNDSHDSGERVKLDFGKVQEKMRELIAQNMKTGVIDKSFTFHDEEALDLYVDNLFGTELYPNWSHATAGFESLDVSMEDLMMKVQPDGTQGREADIIGNIYGSKPSDVNFDSYDFQTFF